MKNVRDIPITILDQQKAGKLDYLFMIGCVVLVLAVILVCPPVAPKVSSLIQILAFAIGGGCVSASLAWYGLESRRKDKKNDILNRAVRLISEDRLDEYPLPEILDRTVTALIADGHIARDAQFKPIQSRIISWLVKRKFASKILSDLYLHKQIRPDEFLITVKSKHYYDLMVNLMNQGIDPDRILYSQDLRDYAIVISDKHDFHLIQLTIDTKNKNGSSGAILVAGPSNGKISYNSGSEEYFKTNDILQFINDLSNENF